MLFDNKLSFDLFSSSLVVFLLSKVVFLFFWIFKELIFWIDGGFGRLAKLKKLLFFKLELEINCCKSKL